MRALVTLTAIFTFPAVSFWGAVVEGWGRLESEGWGWPGVEG